MCSYLTTRESNFKRHKETCGKPKPKVTHECSVCKKVFLRKCFYLKHIKIHYDKVNQEKKIECNICFLTFMWPYSLKNNLKGSKVLFNKYKLRFWYL